MEAPKFKTIFKTYHIRWTSYIFYLFHKKPALGKHLILARSKVKLLNDLYIICTLNMMWNIKKNVDEENLLSNPN